MYCKENTINSIKMSYFNGEINIVNQSPKTKYIHYNLNNTKSFLIIFKNKTNNSFI